MKTIFTTCAIAAALALGGGASAQADWGDPWYGGYTYQSPSYYYYSYPQYRTHYWHDTSHWDYHPGQYVPHGNHYHYEPGHYHWHQQGHWH